MRGFRVHKAQYYSDYEQGKLDCSIQGKNGSPSVKDNTPYKWLRLGPTPINVFFGVGLATHPGNDSDTLLVRFSFTFFYRNGVLLPHHM